MNTALKRRLAFILAGVLLLAAFAWAAVRSGPLAPIRVTLASVSRDELQPNLFGIGVVEARRTYNVGPTAAGRVRRVAVDVGDVVRAGQLLAEIDPVDLDQRLASSTAAVARARSAVETATAQLADSAGRREVAVASARRYDELGRQGFVSSSVSEVKSQEQKSAEAQVAAATAALAGSRQDLARLDAERQGVHQQRVNLRLLAPAAGIVAARDAEPGSTVVAGQAVVRLIAPDSLWVKVRLDQSRSAGLRVGLPADIVLRSLSGQALKGKVARVEMISDSVTEERIAQISFDALPATLSVGEMAEVTLQLPTGKPALSIPSAALRMRGGKPGVWLNAGDHPRFAAVRIGAVGANGRIQVLEGLQQGDSVIVYTERDLAEDSRIQVVPSLTASGT
ncbi:MAG: efflux RND transporter periplasmic adaptor subunit [Sterolibacterium sp.]|jgi:HlyD family secretion protein